MPTQGIAGYGSRVYGSIDAGANYREYGELRNATLHRSLDPIDATSHASAGDEENITGHPQAGRSTSRRSTSRATPRRMRSTPLSPRTPRCSSASTPRERRSGKERWSGDRLLHRLGHGDADQGRRDAQRQDHRHRRADQVHAIVSPKRATPQSRNRKAASGPQNPARHLNWEKTGSPRCTSTHASRRS
jgi:hypothetical protein